MAGIYIHIPFCRKYCSYCDFYRIKSLDDLPDYLDVLEKEISLRRDYLGHEEIESIYFGGGTPSLLEVDQINHIMDSLLTVHTLTGKCEITLEANPDDLSMSYLKQLKNHGPVNRLSIGIQSFSDEDLLLLNRRHDARRSFSCLEDAIAVGFDNISIDLIYGLPGMTLNSWVQQLNHAFGLNVQHISAYHLSLEPGTSLYRMAGKGSLEMPSEEVSLGLYLKLCEHAKKHNYRHYEISNLCREGYQAIHNSGYWKQKKYLGLGPSAHSFDLASRQWNIADTGRYIQGMRSFKPEYSYESIDHRKRLNECIMLSLRAQWGIDLEALRKDFGASAAGLFESASEAYLASGHMVRTGDRYFLTEEAWFISDHIISSLLADE